MGNGCLKNQPNGSFSNIDDISTSALPGRSRKVFNLSIRSDADLANKRIEGQLKKSQQEEASIVTVLLLGTAECGKSTILKQIKYLHATGK